MTKRYAIIDASSANPNLEVQQGGLVLTFNVDGTTISRNARADQVLTSGRWTWEAAGYGIDELSGTNFAAGIVLDTTPSTDYPGHAASTYGITGDGGIWSNGVKIATVGAPKKQDIIVFALDLDSPVNTLEYRVNDASLYTFTVASGHAWQPAGVVAGATAGNLSLYMNFGRRKMKYSPPSGFKAGVYSNIQTSGSGFWSSEDFRLPPTADQPNLRYQKRIMKPLQFYVQRAITFWPDGQSGSSFSAADLDLWNGDGALDALLLDPPTSAKIVYAIVDLDDPSIAPVVVATTVVDTCTQPERDTLRIKQLDPLGKWDVPLQKQFIPPWAADGAANLPYPISLGGCVNVEGILVDSDNRVYVAHDDHLTQIYGVRDKGDPLDPTVDPPDFTPSADLRGVQTQTQPEGTLTIDISSQGASNLTPVSGVDLLGGIGLMATATGGFPTGWSITTAGAGVNGAMVGSQVATDGGRMRLQSGAPAGGTQTTRFLASVKKTAAISFLSGKRYRITWDIKDTNFNAVNQGDQSFRLFIDGTTVAQTVGNVVIGHNSATFIAPHDGGILGFVFNWFYDTTQSAAGKVPPWFVEIDNVLSVQLPDPLAADPDANPMVGITLADYGTEILELRGEASPADWSKTDAQAIDTVNPYTFGVSIKDAVTINAGIRAPLDSFCASITNDEAGVARIVQWKRPENALPSDVVYRFNRNNMKAMPLGTADPATGLTATAGVLPNWKVFTDSDFVTDFSSETGIDAATRARFKRQSQYLVKSTANLHDSYRKYIDADPVPFVFLARAHGQLKIDEVCNGYTIARNNFTWDGFHDPMSPPPMLLGGVVEVTWSQLSALDRPSPIFGTGKYLVVKDEQRFPLAGQITINKGWG